MTIEDVREFEHKMQENTNKLVLDGVEPAGGATPWPHPLLFSLPPPKPTHLLQEHCYITKKFIAFHRSLLFFCFSKNDTTVVTDFV